LASRLVLLPPRDPESKGLVERRNGWFETSFMPGRGFRSPGDFNTRFSGWLVLGNARVVRTLKARPVDLLAADRAAMLALPPVPLHLGWHQRIRLGRDYCVREAAPEAGRRFLSAPRGGSRARPVMRACRRAGGCNRLTKGRIGATTPVAIPEPRVDWPEPTCRTSSSYIDRCYSSCL
jgi:hypothetical protein